MKLGEFVNKMRKYADVKEIWREYDNIVIVFDTDEIKSSPFDNVYVSAWDFKIKRSLVGQFSVEPLDTKKIRVYLFLKNIEDETRINTEVG